MILKKINLEKIGKWLAAGIFFILIIIYFLVLPEQFYLIDQFHSEAVVPDFYGQKEISQTFWSAQHLDTIAIKFATFGRRNQGRIQFQFYVHEAETNAGPTSCVCKRRGANQKRELIWSGTIDMDQLQDNSYYVLEIPPEMRQHQGCFTLVLRAPNATKDNCVSPWFSLFNAYDRGTLCLDSETGLGDLTFRVGVRSTALNLILSMSDSVKKYTLGSSNAVIYGLLTLFIWSGVLFIYFVGTENVDQ